MIFRKKIRLKTKKHRKKHSKIYSIKRIGNEEKIKFKHKRESLNTRYIPRNLDLKRKMFRSDKENPNDGSGTGGRHGRKNLN